MIDLLPLNRRRLASFAQGVTFAALLAGAASAGPVHAQESGVRPLPLTGAAFRVAQQAYDAFNRHDYAASISKAREAIRQRPDVIELRLLLANALAASRRYKEARRSLADAIVELGPDRALVMRRKQIDALSASIAAAARNRSRVGANGGSDTLSGPALLAAQKAYQAYAAKDYAGALRFAGEAIALRPDVLRLRLLQIDAASAAGETRAAWDADVAAVARFGDHDELRVRRAFIGSLLAPEAARAAQAARVAGDLPQAIELLHQVIAYAPDRIGSRLQLFEALLALNDLPALDTAASQAIAYDNTEMMPFTFRGYARAAQGRFEEADADFSRALAIKGATSRDQRVVRAIIADVWIAQGKPQQALQVLAGLKPAGDDTDPLIFARRYQATRQLKSPSQASADDRLKHVNRGARPIIDCTADEFGASCDVYAADPGFAVTRALNRAISRGDKAGAVKFAREAVAAAPDDAQHRVELINALSTAGDEAAATREAQEMIKAGTLDALPDMSAAYIAQRAGDNRVAYQHFSSADKAGAMPVSAAADAGYAAAGAHRNREAARYFERAMDTSAKPADDGTPPATPEQLNEMRSAHADATRNWGFDASLNYRGAGLQPGYATSATPSTSNNWQAGLEAYWRPFGSLGDRSFELYARGYESFGVKHGGASGASTSQVAVGARAKPLAQVDAIVAFERIFPIGSQVNPDWLARLAYSGGVGIERRVDVPSWWTAQVYAETGTYLNAGSVYATTNVEVGRTYRMDRYSPKWTVFPYAVIGADYDSSVDHSFPLGAGIGVSTRYWFRDSKYDAPRSYVDLSVQYRLKIAGDDRARGVFFGAIYSY